MSNPWIISYRKFDPNSIRLRESILTLGNGYFATRGAHEEGNLPQHYPGFYLGGVYNRLTTQVAGHDLCNEDLVNGPNWLPIFFRVEGEEWFSLEQVKILSYRQILHLKKGLLKRIVHFEDAKGRVFILNTLRFVSQDDPHVAGISYILWSKNWSGNIQLRSSIIADVRNLGVARYQELQNQHLKIMSKGSCDNYLYLLAKTNQSGIEVAQVVKTELWNQKILFPLHPKMIEESKNIHHEFTVNLQPYNRIKLLKTMICCHSLESENPLIKAKEQAQKTPELAQLLKKQIVAWEDIWKNIDIEIKTNNKKYSRFIHLHLFHALQTYSKHSIGRIYGLPARGLHGEAYRGHVFWDEVFILPFYITHYPKIAREALLYRYHRLEEAKKKAEAAGFSGAMFPWQSASTGSEETQERHLNPLSLQWGPDHSALQRHVNLAIAYNIWNYYIFTEDIEFMEQFGAEMLLAIAMFMVSLSRYNPLKKRYEIKSVMGPDEYHEGYPGANAPGLDNNAYTNIMTVWVLEKALAISAWLKPKIKAVLFERLNLKPSNLKDWQHITTQMYVPFHENVISQFEHYEKLKELDWPAYQKKYGSIERLDRILKAEGETPDAYKVAKQPDVLMLFYLLNDAELSRLLHQLGYEFNQKLKARTIDYYLKRTSHGSTLSKMILAALFAKENGKQTEYLFQEALRSDIEDIQGGTTAEGIHLGVMVGTITVLTHWFSGVQIQESGLSFTPKLPPWITALKFKLLFKDIWYEVNLDKDRVFVTKRLIKKQKKSSGKR